MNKQAQVGLFTILGLIAVFAVFFVLADFGTRSRGYKVGVHFHSASGLRVASLVYLSGVPIGAVDGISLLPDYTTEVVLAVKPGYEIPVGSHYLIQAPITGEPTVLITPPRDAGRGARTIAHEVLPVAQQPSGTNPATFAELLEEGQGEVRRLDNILAQVQQAEPKLLGQLSSTLANANALTTNANRTVGEVTRQVEQLTDSLQSNLTVASRNVVDLTGGLDAVMNRDAPKVDVLFAQLTRTSKSFGETVDSLHDIATNPKVKGNLVATTRDFALTAKTFADLTQDLRRVTGNPQTQSQLRDTVAQLDATSQKVDSLVGSLGGTSSVYGVDPNASPAPAPSGAPAPPNGNPANATPGDARAPSGAAAGAPAGTSSGNAPKLAVPATGKLVATLRGRLDRFTRDLYELQIRASDLAPLRPGSAARNTSPLLTADRGPQSDFNLFVLPRASTGLKLGVNDIGSNGTSTANVVLIKRGGPFSYGGGIEYSRLGFETSVATRLLGLEARGYDLRHPTLDTYLNIFAAPKIQLFGGERDVSHASRRSVFGLQFEF